MFDDEIERISEVDLLTGKVYNSYALYNLDKAGKSKDGTPEPPAELIIEFNVDATPVTFKNNAINNNSAIKSLKLPLVQDKKILDNILYSGVWMRYRKREEGDHDRRSL